MTDYNTFIPVGREMELLLLSMLSGIAMGGVYDLLRVFRMSVKHSAPGLFAEDFAFTLGFGINWYIICTALCHGALRGFLLAGMAAGFFLYIYTVGIITNRLFFLLLCVLGKIGKKIRSFLLSMRKLAKRSKKSS